SPPRLSRLGTRPRLPRVRAKSRTSAPGDRGDDREGLARLDGRVEPLEEADVLVGHEHVDEPAQLAAVVEQPLAEAGVGGVERLQDLADGGAADGHLA